MINILDKGGYINSFKMRVTNQSHIEHAGFAIVKQNSISEFTIRDFAHADSLGILGSASSLFIPKELSIALIRVCIHNDLVPMVLHSHTLESIVENDLSFSIEDMSFIRRFAKVAVNFKLTSPLFFYLTEGINDFVYAANAYNCTNQIKILR